MSQRMDGTASSLLYVHPQDRRRFHPERLTSEAQSPVETAASVDEAVGACGDRTHCVLAHFDLADGTACDIAGQLDDDGTPLVALVDATGDSVPADALSPGLAETVPITGDATDFERVRDALDQFVPTDDGPTIAGQYPGATQSLDEWKADILDRYFTEIPLHLFVKDREGRHLLVSEAEIGDRMDRSLDTYLGKRDIDGVISEGAAQEPYEDDMAVIESGEPIIEKEEHYPSTDHWFLTSKIPWYDSNGEPAGLLGVSREITERKRRERHLRVTTHMLRHNLRNELTVISGGVGHLRGRIPEEDQSVADRIDRAATRLLDKIEKQETIVELLTDSPCNRTVDVRQLVRDETASARTAYPNATIRCRCDTSVTASAIPDIDFAIEELVRNAAEHADSPEPEIVVEAERVGDHVEIRVVDDCAPIPDHEIAVLSGERSITQLTHGAGLGLWMIHWIVTRSGGAIEFETANTGGNVVTVTLPVDDETADRPDAQGHGS